MPDVYTHKPSCLSSHDRCAACNVEANNSFLGTPLVRYHEDRQNAQHVQVSYLFAVFDRSVESFFTPHFLE